MSSGGKWVGKGHACMAAAPKSEEAIATCIDVDRPPKSKRKAHNLC